MPNKSLEDHLFNRAYPFLPWNLRLQIALGAAEGLAYLHEGLEVQVIYRKLKDVVFVCHVNLTFMVSCRIWCADLIFNSWLT